MKQLHTLIQKDRNADFYDGTRFDVINRYDFDGNFMSMSRYSSFGGVLDNFAYVYNSGTNKLQRVTGSGTQFEYDANGNVTNDYLNGNIYIKYDHRNLITQVTKVLTQFPPSNQVTLYRYDEEGNRTRKVIYITAEPDPEFPGGELDNPPSGWDLVRDFFYLRGADGLEFAVYNSYDLEYYNVWAGNENVEINNFNYLSKSRFGGIAKITSGNEVQHYIKDHLGSIRVTIDDDNQVLSAQDYDPWGFMLHERTYNQENTTYKFTGKQRDNETEYDYFGARYYDSRIGRWTSIDPLYNLDLNYSPFAYVSNNPLYFIDPNGQFKYPTKYENEYSKNYSKFTQMLKNISIIENDNSLLDAISKFSGLSLNRIKDDFKWGNGPFIEFIDIPGDNLGMFKTGISSDVLT